MADSYKHSALKGENMWECKVCQANTEDDSWEVCWNCSSSRNLSDDEIAKARQEIVVAVEVKQEQAQQMECIRCQSHLRYLGSRRIHEGTNWGFWFGDLGEAFINNLKLDQFYCPNCGKVEFFVNPDDMV